MNGFALLRSNLRPQLACHVLFGLLLLRPAAHAATNTYISPVSGKWEISTNWSLGAPGSNDFIFITNSGTKAVLLDATTSTSPTLALSNFFINSPPGATNTLLLSGVGLATPLEIGDTFELRDHSAVVIDNSSLRVRGLPGMSALRVGTAGSNNRLTITNGGLAVSREVTVGQNGSNNMVLVTGAGSRWVNTNNSFVLANNAPGVALIVSNGATLQTRSSFIGNGTAADGNVAILTDPGSTWSNSLLRLDYTGAQLIISNGATTFSAAVDIGNNPNRSNRNVTVTGPGSLWVCTDAVRLGLGGLNDSITVTDGGSLIVTNAAGTALMTVNKGLLNLGNGTFKYDHLILTNGARLMHLSDLVIAPDGGSTSTVNVAATTLQAATNLIVAPAANTVAQVTISDGGTLTVTNGTLGIGNNGTLTGGSGTGRMIVSNGTVMAASVLLGSSVGGSGQMNITAGGHLMTKGLARNQLLVTGGTVEVVSGSLEPFEDPLVHNRIVGGYLHDSEMEITGGSVTTPEMLMGVTTGKIDVLKMSGGALIVQSNLVVGDCTTGTYGVIDLKGGNIYVTNAAHDAALVLRQGSLSVSNGTIVADRIIATNGCRITVTNMGGITYVHIIADPGGDIDNDGLPNAWEQARGLDALSNVGANGADGDPDGDGQSNQNEYLAGTDPKNAESVFRFLGARLLNQDMRLDWAAVGRQNYVVQLATNVAGGSPTNFFDLSAVIAVDGTNEVITNYLHLDAVTNRGGLYRIRTFRPAQP